MQIFAFDIIPSTMVVAQDILKTSVESVFCVLAKAQESGIGTNGRQWHSPIGNFYATYCFKNCSQELLTKISLVSGVAVVQALKTYSVDAALKWTNDIIINDKKVGGILCQFYDNALLIGIGLNFKVNPMNETQGAFFQSDTISECLDIDYSEFATILGKHLKHHLTALETDGFEHFIQIWHDYAAFRNREIEVQLPNDSIKKGIDKGINHDACLLLETQSGIEYFYSARITKVF